MPPEVEAFLREWWGLSAASIVAAGLLWRVLRMIAPGIASAARVIGTSIWGMDPSVMDARRLLAADEETFRKSMLAVWDSQGRMMADMDRRLKECLQHHDECERKRERDHVRIAHLEARAGIIPFPGEDG